jgi:hypothetical protein
MKMPKTLLIGTISSPVFFMGHLVGRFPSGKVAMRFFFLEQHVKEGMELPSDGEW